jgi:hypothetical protein
MYLLITLVPSASMVSYATFVLYFMRLLMTRLDKSVVEIFEVFQVGHTFGFFEWEEQWFSLGYVLLEHFVC